MTDTLQVRDNKGAVLESVVIDGNLEALSAEGRVAYYRQVCESLGLNPFTKPFDYIRLNGKLTLYARRDATDQLRALRDVSVEIVSRERADDIYIVKARATTKDGRTDESIGAVSVMGLKGEPLANAYMKCETKAKRRVTLSIVGLGWLDENEVETVPGAQRVTVDGNTGEVIDVTPVRAEAPKRAPAAAAAKPLPVAVGKNWTDDTRLANKFMAKAIDALGITGRQVYEALGVTQISEWRYSMDDAKAQIQQWIDQQQARDEPGPEDEQEDDAAPYDDNGFDAEPVAEQEPLL